MGRHNTSRSSRSMRGLPKGRTTYSFPDHIWKVKKPKGKGWKTRRKGSPAQIGQKFKAKTKPKPIKTKATSFRIALPEKRKPPMHTPKKKQPLTETQREIREKILNKTKFYEQQGWEIRKNDIIKQVAAGKHSDTLVKEQFEALERQGMIKRVHKPERKTKKLKKPAKKHKIKPPKPRMKMTHIEKMHLLAQCKQFNVDPQEIDNTITYYENKKHVQEMAQAKGFSEEEIKGVEGQQREVASQMERYYGNLKSELEEVGYIVQSPY